MSDGPHRSLPLRSSWKRAAEYADNEAFSAEETCDAVVDALRKDWSADVPNTLVASVAKILAGQPSLFGDQRLSQLEQLAASSFGSNLSRVFLDCATYAAQKSDAGSEATLSALADALTEWASRHGRSIEEHYLRESHAKRAQNVRARLEQGTSSPAIMSLARRLLGLDASPRQSQVGKLNGLDDGVIL